MSFMITSRSNSKVKEIRLLKQAKYRQMEGRYFIEGVRLVEEALSQSVGVEKIAYSPRLEETQRGLDLLCLARQKLPDSEWLYLSDDVMGTLSDTQSHQGILAVLKKKEWKWEDVFARPGLILLFHELQDPGNLGLILRVADAGGVAGVVLSRKTIDPYNPKAVRASMGSLFRVPVLTGQDMGECLSKLRSRGYQIWATALRGKPSFWEVKFSLPTAVLFGQEGCGLPDFLTEAAGASFSIPMSPQMESLNVAIASALVVYEAFRQAQGIREHGSPPPLTLQNPPSHRPDL